MLHKDIIKIIEDFAPPIYQESYDNSGWQVGNPSDTCTGVLIALDATMEILHEAIATGCNLIITHHPLIFGKIKKIVGATAIDQWIIAAIKHDITLYACHTNLDNMAAGVNKKIADKLGLADTRILQPKQDLLYKLVTYVPIHDKEQLLQALWDAGAGKIGAYEECAFTMEGLGTFKPMSQANPTIGMAGGARETVTEARIEVLVPEDIRMHIIQTLRHAHPYEAVAYELISIANANQYIGAGMVGTLPEALPVETFLAHVKHTMQAAVIRYTPCNKSNIQRVGICGGSGSFLLPDAIRQQCDAFITADYKYHQFFESEGKIMITDIGHYESEQYTSEIFYDIIKDKFPNFAVRITTKSTNPINYYY